MPIERVEFDTTKKSLDELLRKAREGSLQLPDFQRGWVWDDEGITSLLTSISRSFPVGALMTLQTGGEVRFKPRLIEGAPPESASQTPEALLLDGQQRITSLYQTTMRQTAVQTTNAKKQRIERWYYIDMVAALTEDGRNRAIIGVPASKIETKNFGREIVRDLSTTSREYENMMFPLNRVFDDRDWQHGFEDFWYARGDREKRNFYRDFYDKILSAFLRYHVPVIELGRSTTREAVCLVFEKVNTGGKKLDAFELLTAIYAADEFDLRKDWLGDCVQSGRLKRLARHNTLNQLQSTEFLQAISLLFTLRRRRNFISNGGTENDAPAVNCTRDSLLALPLAAYRELAELAERGFETVARFLRAQRVYWFKDIPYQSQLVPLAAILAEIGDRWTEDAVRRRLARWFWSGVFGELYGSAIETRFARDIAEVPTWISDGPEPSTVRDAAFRADRLDTMTSRLSAAYKGVHAILMAEGARDFRSGQSFDDSIYFDEAVDIHHIFPRAWCERKGIRRERYDTIVNKTPLTGRTNRIVGGNAPSVYLARLREAGAISDQALDEHLRTHVIDPAILRSDDFDSFYQARRDQLLRLIEKAMGREVYRGDERDEPVGTVVDEELDLSELAAE